MLRSQTVPQLLQEAWHLFSAGRFEASLDAYGTVLAGDSRHEGALLGCGFCRLQLGTPDLAADCFRRLLALKPDFPPALAGFGEAMILLGRPDEALTAYQALGRADPGSALAFHGQGDALSQLGRMAEARRAYEEAVRREPGVAHHHFALAGAGRFVDGDRRLAPLQALARNAGGLDEAARCELHFALGKAHDELDQPQVAFRHWQEGNAIRRKATAYNEAEALEMIGAMARTFSLETLTAKAGVGDASPLPVFVVGMPRSGTTLVEQILASHPAVYGAGEMTLLFRQIGEGWLGHDFPAEFSALPDTALQQFGASYAAQLAALAPTAKRVVDKLPANFLLVGLIRLVLPQARIIHVRRDPADTCLSCYSHLFTAAIDYSYDLGELGRYYRAYERLMAHWRTVLPEGATLEVHYEDVVGDLEAQARRMIAYCGLEWDPACLAFHTNNRAVHTLSALQVRQPLYRTSIGRALAYRAWLGPLVQALEAP